MFDLLLSYLLFCVVMAGTPGPNNMMALTSGVRVGIRRSLPLVAGVAAGVGLMLVAVGFGLSVAFKLIPQLHDTLQVVAAIYLVWLAYHIAVSGPIRTEPGTSAPLGFWGAVLFQWINPKAWALTTSIIATFVPHGAYIAGVLGAAVLLSAVAFPSVGVWVAFGNGLRRYLADPRLARRFNGAMAFLLLASTIPVMVAEHMA